jgi:hypothetical protein
MANQYSYQVLKDDTQHAVIKISANFDGTGQEDNVKRIVANSLYGALATNGFPIANVYGGAANTPLSYHGLTVNRVWYDTPSLNSSIELYWANTDVGVTANAGVSLLSLQGNGEYDGNGNWITIRNPTVTANNNGDIAITTRGQTANNSYTIILELRKDNSHYQRGQFNDPAAFNYPPYGLRP